MSIMLLERKAIQSLMAYIDSVLYADGFITSGANKNATLTISFPDKNSTQPIIKPLVIVSNEGGADTPIELGSHDGTQLIAVIDVIGVDAAQRDDVGYLLRKNLRNRYLPIYNFTAGFPSTPGVFTGITTVGKMTVLRTSYDNIDLRIDDTFGFNYHQEIRVTIQLPSD